MSHNFWPRPLQKLEQIKPFLLTLCAVIALFVTLLFGVIYQRTTDLMYQRVREQAMTYADLVNHAKAWNFDYGGVYVEKRPGVESNSYLTALGIKPDVATVDGRTLTMRNHAIMIAEISRRSERQDGISFRITSLWPLDKANTPDAFEREGINRLRQGSREEYHYFFQEAQPVFRYLYPLRADKSCLECHTTRDIKLDEIFGAISISIPLSQMAKDARITRILIFLAALLSIGVMVAVTYFLTWRLASKLRATQKLLERLASTDELTGINNRRQVMARLAEEFQRAERLGESIGLISLDIDHFKHINDTWGHPFGDQVLKQVAERLRNLLRAYDIFGRIGGEEFLVVAPGIPGDEVRNLAERIVTAIHSEPFRDGINAITVTISAGVAVTTPEDLRVEDLLKRADRALYEAKERGRNRVAGP